MKRKHKHRFVEGNDRVMIVDVDYLVIGSGLAGLTYALHMSPLMAAWPC